MKNLVSLSPSRDATQWQSYRFVGGGVSLAPSAAQWRGGGGAEAYVAASGDDQQFGPPNSSEKEHLQMLRAWWGWLGVGSGCMGCCSLDLAPGRDMTRSVTDATGYSHPRMHCGKSYLLLLLTYLFCGTCWLLSWGTQLAALHFLQLL